MKKERIKAQVADLVLNEGQLPWLPANPRQWTRTDLDKLKKSLQCDEDFQEDRPALAMRWEDKLLVFAGNLRTTAAKELKWSTLDTIIYTPENDEDREAIKRRAILDNGSFGEWDIALLADEWGDLPLSDWGVKTTWDEVHIPEVDTQEEYERRKKEFEERIAAGEMSEGDEEYQEFLDKFAVKKTTDDCYTPKLVYEAVENYVAERYGVDKTKFIRPFYPNGDYRKENYKGLIVVDNPPFSIMSEILKFYNEKGIPFFLFGPHLTLFSSSSSATAICTGVPVIYENGASVNTSFLTNMEGDVRFRSAPDLYKAVSEAVSATQREKKKELPKYQYDRHVVTTTWLGQLSRLGIDFSANRNETEAISQLDSQRDSGKAIYGKGYLISEQKYAEREKAEREKAEVWELSEREREIVRKLSN